MEQFIITLSNDSKYTVKPVFEGENLSYQISIDGKAIGSITPFVEDLGLVWRSDDIDPFIIEEIGELIEDHEA